MELIKRNTDYALRALVYLAENEMTTPRPICDIAAATGAPESFLRKVVQKLDSAGVVATKRGVSGGVSFRKSPHRISVLEVVEAVQGPVAVNKCFVPDGVCADRTGCRVRRNLKTIQKDLIDLFGAATVGQLAARNEDR